MISPLSFLIVFIWIFSCFFLVSLARGLLILFTLSKNYLLVSFCFVSLFSFVSLSSILFISSLNFIFSLLLLTLGFIYSFFFPYLFVGSLDCLFEFFLLSLSFFPLIFRAAPVVYGSSWARVESELKLQAYATATPMQDPSYICSLCHSLQKY